MRNGLDADLAIIDKRRSDDGTGGSDERRRRRQRADVHHPRTTFHSDHTGGHDREGGPTR